MGKSRRGNGLKAVGGVFEQGLFSGQLLVARACTFGNYPAGYVLYCVRLCLGYRWIHADVQFFLSHRNDI